MLLIWIWSNINTIRESDQYQKAVLVVDSLYTSGKGTGSSKTKFAVGFINNERKSVLLQSRTILRDTIVLGDSLLVWNIKGKGSILLRDKSEFKFDKNRYKYSNLKIILFGFIPIILLWVFRYLVSKKLSSIENI